MLKKQLDSLNVPLVASLSALLLFCATEKTGITQPQKADPMYGYLYHHDGSPAKNAHVTILPENFVPVQGLSKKKVSSPALVTDENGRFAMENLAAGTYNIYGRDDSNASFAPSVRIDAASGTFKDTLKTTGSIKGIIRFSPKSDSRTVLILVLGSTIIGWPDDTNGNFTLKNLAPGSYKVRFLPTNSKYPVKDTAFTVESGKSTDVGTIGLVNPDKYAVSVENLVFPNGAVLLGKKADSAEFYKGVALRQKLDGGAGRYLAEGFLNSAFQNFALDDTSCLQIESMILDFGTAEIANSMFRAEKFEREAENNFQESDSLILYIPIVGGVHCIAHKENIYFEINATCFDNLGYAIAEAGSFLNLYFNKIAELKAAQGQI